MNSKHYVSKKEMVNELIKLKETDLVSEKLHLMFYEMANRIANKPRFYSYTWKEDMIVDAYLRCIRYAKKFDVKKSNPFGYFTTLIYNVYFNYREVELKYQDRKWSELSNHIDNLEITHRIKVEMTEDIKSKMYKATANTNGIS